MRRARRSAAVLVLGIAITAAGCLPPGGAFMANVSGFFLEKEGNLVDAEKAYLAAANSRLASAEEVRTAQAALAELYQRQQRWDEAAVFLEKYLASERAERKGGSAGSVRTLAELRWQQGRRAEATQLLVAAMNDFPKARAFYLVDLAEFRRREGRCEDARRLLCQAMARRVSFLVEERLAPLLEEMGRDGEAADVYADMELRLRFDLRPEEDRDFPHGARRLAEFLEARQRYAEALPLRVAVLSRNEKGWTPALGTVDIDEARRAVRDAYLKLGRYADAEQLYLGLPQLASRDSLVDDLIVVYHAEGRLVEAEQLARRLLEARKVPPSKPRQSGLAGWFEDLGGDDEDDAREHRHTHASDQIRLARILLHAHRASDADVMSAEALSVREADLVWYHPRMAQALELRAAVLDDLGRGDDASVLEGRASAIRTMHARGPASNPRR